MSSQESAAFLRLLVMRHAESTANREGRMAGHGDFPLTPIGEAQAYVLAQRLQAEQCVPTHLYTSPLQRAVETAAILQTTCPTRPPVSKDPDLSEHQNGIFQGLTWDEAQAQYPDLCAQLMGRRDWVPIPEAETLVAGRERAQRFLQRLLTQHQNGDRVLCVTHSWLLEHLVATILGCDRTWQLATLPTALFEFWIDQSRWDCRDQNRYNNTLWQIRRFNDATHLG